LGNQIKEDEIGEECSPHDNEKWIKVLVGKAEGNTPFGTHGRRWEDNITVDLREIGWEHVEWIHLTHERD
jgi:hypothetical protein